METIARAFLWITLFALLLVVPRWTRTHPNIDELARMDQEVHALETQAQRLAYTNSRTIDHILALSHAPHARAAQAKQIYDLINKNEILIRFDEED